MSFTTECMTFCDKSVLSSVAAGRIQLHWSILVAASLGCALLDAHWAKINFKILSSMSLWDWSKITTNHILSMNVRDYFIIYYYCFRGILLDLLFVIFFGTYFGPNPNQSSSFWRKEVDEGNDFSAPPQ